MSAGSVTAILAVVLIVFTEPAPLLPPLDRTMAGLAANMKRGGPGEAELDTKRSRAYTDKFECRVLVPSKVTSSPSLPLRLCMLER